MASVLNSPMVDSNKALSRASPTVPMESAIPGVEQLGGQHHGHVLDGLNRWRQHLTWRVLWEDDRIGCGK